MSNIREVAKISGVSIGTVSRYINHNGYVSKEASEKIQAAIDELDYTPNHHARAIFNNRSGTVGVVLPSLINPYFAQLANAWERLLRECGYSIILCNTADCRHKELSILNLLKSYRVDGIIIGRPLCIESLEKMSIPVVSYENSSSTKLMSVSADNYNGGRSAFAYLKSKGAKRLLHIKGPSIFEATELRCQGFLDAAQDAGERVAVMSFQSDFDPAIPLAQLFKGIHFEDYDGIFVFNDIAASLLLRYLHELAIDVPQSIKVISFDNSFLCELVSPRLTSIEQPVEAIANCCVDRLQQMMEGKLQECQKIEIPTTVVERDSC